MTAEAVSRDLSLKTRLSLSDRIDRVVTSRTLGLPLFFTVAQAVFRLTYMIGDPLVEILESLVEILGERAAGILGAAGARYPRVIRPGRRHRGEPGPWWCSFPTSLSSSPSSLFSRIRGTWPGGVRHGPAHAPHGAPRKKLHPHAHGVPGATFPPSWGHGYLKAGATG